MNQHWRYFKYVATHKWHVFWACLKYGLILRGIIHDWSKFRPSEWFAYANYDFSKGLPKTTGYLHQVNPDELAFNVAMNRHHKRNTHHWEYWVLVNKDGTTLPLPMPLRDAQEMVADWRGAGMAQGKPDTVKWYHVNRNNIQLHPDTRKWVETELAYEDYMDELEAVTHNISPLEVKRQRLARQTPQ